MNTRTRIKCSVTIGFLVSVLAIQGCSSLGEGNAVNKETSSTHSAKILIDEKQRDDIRKLRIATESGDPASHNALGEALYNTANSDEEFREAMMHLKRAYSGGIKVSSNIIAKMYALGQGVEEEHLTAAQWFDRFQRAGGHPDWTILNGPPQTGYAEARFRYMKRLRLQNDSWIPLKDIKEMYGCCSFGEFGNDPMPAQHVLTAHWNAYRPGEKYYSQDGDHYYFDAKGRAIKYENVSDGKIAWEFSRSYDETNNTAIELKKIGSQNKISRYHYDDTKGFSRRDVLNSISYSPIYNYAGNLFFSETQDGLTRYVTAFDPSTGEQTMEGVTIDRKTKNVKKWKCAYQQDYTRLCTETENGMTSEVRTFSPMGWLLKSLSYGYCENGAIYYVDISSYDYKEEDNQGNWTEALQTHRKIWPDKQCIIGKYKVGQMPTSWDRTELTTVKRKFTYQ